jgi:hypothetical protein
MINNFVFIYIYKPIYMLSPMINRLTQYLFITPTLIYMFQLR